MVRNWILPYFCFLFYSGLQRTEWGSPTLGKTTDFIQSADSKANLIQKHSPRYTQNNGCPMFQSSWLKKKKIITGLETAQRQKLKAKVLMKELLLSWRNTRHQYESKPPASKLHWRASLVTRGKESACQCRRYRFNPWPRKIPYSVKQLNPRINHKLESRFLGEI